MRWSTLILVSFAACSKSSSPEPAKETKDEKAIEPIKIPDPTAPTEAARAAPTKSPVASTDTRMLTEKMQREAANRPRAGVLAEPLFDALEQKAGITLLARRQYLGSTMSAAFCAGGYTSDHLTVSMCEYPDDKAAQASLDYMNKYFNFPNAQRRMHKAAVLTVIAPSTDARAGKALQTFESM